MGYHKTKIDKGVLGEFSKIIEEYQELEDAYSQGDKILILCEISDLIGAMDLFLSTNFKMSIEDAIKFNKKTAEAFKEGKR